MGVGEVPGQGMQPADFRENSGIVQAERMKEGTRLAPGYATTRVCSENSPFMNCCKSLLISTTRVIGYAGSLLKETNAVRVRWCYCHLLM